MKPRTLFRLSGSGLVHCYSGALRDFVRDINDFILPILEDSITAEFNYKRVTVNAHDDPESIYNQFIQALNI